MTTSQLIASARKHYIAMTGGMKSSAEVCLGDAIQQYDAGNYDSARIWALKSLAYSVGVFHNDYKKAVA